MAGTIDGIVGLDAAPKVVSTLGLLAAVAVIGGFYRLGIDGARSVGGELDAPELRRAFAHTLVPIALVYVIAHYLTFLLFEGQATFYLASDPFGEGRSPSSSWGTWRRSRSPTTGRSRSPAPRAWPCARSTGCSP